MLCIYCVVLQLSGGTAAASFMCYRMATPIWYLDWCWLDSELQFLFCFVSSSFSSFFLLYAAVVIFVAAAALATTIHHYCTLLHPRCFRRLYICSRHCFILQTAEDIHNPDIVTEYITFPQYISDIYRSSRKQTTQWKNPDIVFQKAA
jgi:hypothetical protein